MNINFIFWIIINTTLAIQLTFYFYYYNFKIKNSHLVLIYSF